MAEQPLQAERSLIAIVTPAFGSTESVEALKKEIGNVPTDVRLVAPAVEINPLHHTLGDIDKPREEAGERLKEAVAIARAAGLSVSAEVGDPDPVQAAQDALLMRPADEIIIFAHADDEKDWYEGELWKHAEDSLEPPLKLVVLDGGPDQNEHVVKIATSSAGLSNNDASEEANSPYLPGISRGDLYGMVFGIFGTIAAIILAAVAAAGGDLTGWRALTLGLTVAVILVNLAHTVGLLLMEAVRYRGGFAKMFSRLALFGTPIVVLINLAVVLFD